MLYVHSQGYTGFWHILDTDDGVTETVSDGRLEAILRRSGVVIRGCEVDSSGHLVSVKQYDASVEGASTLITKLKMLYGIDVAHDNGCIDLVAIPRTIKPSRLMIKLSDLGIVCGYSMLNMRGPDYDGQRRLTLVLDDSLGYTSGTFHDFPVSNIHIDIRKLTKKSAVDEIYFELCKFCTNWFDEWSLVIDRSERFDIRLAEFAMGVGRIDRSVTDPPFIDKKRASLYVCKKYGESFMKIAGLDYSSMLFKEKSFSFASNKVLGWLRWQTDWKEVLAKGDYREIRGSRLSDIFDVWIEYFIEVDKKELADTMRRFRNYVNYFEVESVIQRAFVRLCRNAAPVLSDLEV